MPGESDAPTGHAPEDEAPSDSLAPGSVVGDYEIVAEMGRGAMGALFTARKGPAGDPVGIEVVPASEATDTLVARWIRDADVAREFDYAGAAKAIDFGRDEKAGLYYWAMDLVEGGTVLARAERLGRLPESEVVGIGRHMASALRHAREEGLCRRAAVPANIMLTRRGAVKLLNTGLVMDVAPDAAEPPSWAVELRRYASPELADGSGGDDECSDIYSLGASLYHMATGRPPFGRTAAGKILTNQLRGRIPWPSDVNPAISAGLSAVIAKMMAKDPAERFATLTEARIDLDIVKQGLEPVIASQAPSRSTVAPHSKKATVGRATPLPSAPATREMRAQAAGDNQASEAGARGDRRKLLYLAIGGICAAIGLALLVVALVYAGKRKPRRPPRPGSSSPSTTPVRRDVLAVPGKLTGSCRWMDGTCASGRTTLSP